MRMPGGRHLSTPMMSSTAAAIEATSMKLRPSSQMSTPMPALRSSVLSGGYMNQPPVGAASKRSEEHTSELQSLMRISYAVFCLKKKTYHTQREKNHTHTQSNCSTLRQRDYVCISHTQHHSCHSLQ